MERAIQDFEKLLAAVVSNRRRTRPQDRRSDKEVCESYCTFLVECGVLERENGKFIVGEIPQLPTLLEQLNGDLN